MNERGRRTVEIISIVVIFSLLLGFPIYFIILNNSPDIKHETTRWAIIEDNLGNRLAIEPENTDVWEEFVEYNKPILYAYVKGIVVPYENLWQFRFEPSTISIQNVSSRYLNANIQYIASNLDHLLFNEFGVNIEKIEIFEHKYYGIIGFSVDLVILILAIPIFSFYLVFRNKTQKRYELIKNSILEVKDDLEGISLAMLSQKVDLQQKQVEQLIKKSNLAVEFDLLITDDRIQFKELIYSQSIKQIEEELPNIHQISTNQLTLEHFSKLSQFKADLEEALEYFSKDPTNIAKQTQIKTTLEIISELLESITLDAINI